MPPPKRNAPTAKETPKLKNSCPPGSIRKNNAKKTTVTAGSVYSKNFFTAFIFQLDYHDTRELVAYPEIHDAHALRGAARFADA